MASAWSGIFFSLTTGKKNRWGLTFGNECGFLSCPCPEIKREKRLYCQQCVRKREENEEAENGVLGDAYTVRLPLARGWGRHFLPLNWIRIARNAAISSVVFLAHRSRPTPEGCLLKLPPPLCLPVGLSL